MFVDEARITVKAGNGGDGCVSFRREKYVPQGGPDGGDGGNGGSIVFAIDPGLNTLSDYRYKRKYFAQNGQNGMTGNMRGRNAPDLVLRVPLGTVVKDAETGRVLLDMDGRRGNERVLLKGGRGGWGNARFANSVRQAPRFARPGMKTKERQLILELRLIADVGLVGFPNVGKSTILSVVTRAKPEIANYPFTTVRPNLGVVDMQGAHFVMADIPGIIEGAHGGAGLGLQFLRHVERTRVLIHVIDMAGVEGRDPVSDYYTLLKELESYSPTLAGKPAIVAANKMDIPEAGENLKRFEEETGVKAYPVSAATAKGFAPLLQAAAALLEKIPKPEPEPEAEIDDWTFEEGFEIEVEDGVFTVSGPTVDRILDTTYPDDSDSFRRFQRLLISTGIIDALREKGVRDGDTVYLGPVGFDFVD